MHLHFTYFTETEKKQIVLPQKEKKFTSTLITHTNRQKIFKKRQSVIRMLLNLECKPEMYINNFNDSLPGLTSAKSFKEMPKLQTFKNKKEMSRS